MPVTRLASLRSTSMPLCDSKQHRIDFVVLAQIVDELLQFSLADAERPIGREALGMCDRHIGQGLADDADAQPPSSLIVAGLNTRPVAASKAGALLNAASSVEKDVLRQKLALEVVRDAAAGVFRRR